jgi:hypothetical protein
MSTTGMIVTGVFIFLGIYDMCVVLKSGSGSSISRFLQRTALRAPIVAFALGFAAGHILGYMPPECAEEVGK